MFDAPLDMFCSRMNAARPPHESGRAIVPAWPSSTRKARLHEVTHCASLIIESLQLLPDDVLQPRRLVERR